MVLAHYHAWVPLEELRIACGVSRDGANALSILRAARRYGLEAAGYKRELEQLADEPFPVIAFWGFNHFVVVEGVSRKGLLLNDPAIGRRTADWAEVDRLFTGVTLRLTPGEEFERRGRPPSALRGLLPLASGSWSAVVFALIAGLALVVPALAIPVITKLFADVVIGQNLGSWATAIALVLTLILLVQWYLSRLQQLVTLQFNVKLGLLFGDRLVRRALRLPQSFYDQRFTGDIAYRVTLASEVAAALSGQLAPALLAAVTSLLYLGLLAVLSPTLAGIALVAAIFDALAVWLARRKREELSIRSTKELSYFNGTVAYGLQTIETVKATGGESDLFATMTGVHARAISSWIDFQRPTIVLSAMPTFISQAATLAALGTGAALAIDGDLSLGALLAVTVALAGFLGPIATIVNLGSTLQQLLANLIRMEDLFAQPEDPVLRVKPKPSQRGVPKLRGQLELRGVTFGYSRASPPLLRGLDLQLEPGARVAIVGPTGSGKSTVAKLTAGLLSPWEGEVLLDGRPYLEWPRETITTSLAMVNQDIILFAASVRDNLTLWDRSIEDEELVVAARDAAIHDEIVRRPGGYEATIHEAGLNWSGGERQRLEIARSLAGRPSILVLDEATSALDPVVEFEIDRALRRRGCTALIVAHRLSTIRDCDEIVVLDRGRVVERGTHDELIAFAGHYNKLVTTE
jgi:NHLM bacteriocin system ABC transporter peptidase/ATP-binding protein